MLSSHFLWSLDISLLIFSPPKKSDLSESLVPASPVKTSPIESNAIEAVAVTPPADTQEPANMAPVLNMLDSWGAETPFSQISESAVGGSVLAVSTRGPGSAACEFYVCVCFPVCICSTDGNS